MKLRHLCIENFKRFWEPLRIEDFADGLNLFAAPTSRAPHVVGATVQNSWASMPILKSVTPAPRVTLFQESFMNKDQSKGHIDEAKGKVKEIAGKTVVNKATEMSLLHTPCPAALAQRHLPTRGLLYAKG
jgi:hypothetical protein